MFHPSLYPHFFHIYCFYCFYNDTKKFRCLTKYQESNKPKWFKQETFCSGGPVLPIPIRRGKWFRSYKECINKTSLLVPRGTSKCALKRMTKNNLIVNCTDPIGRPHAYQCAPKGEKWRFYPTNPDFEKYSVMMVYIVMCIICGALTLLLNGAAFFLIMKSKAMRMGNTVLYAAHMAIIDILLALIALPLYIFVVYSKNQYLFKGNKFSSRTYVTVDKWFARIDLMLLIASFMNLSFMSIERCVLVAKPLWYLNKITMKRLIPTIAVIWMYAATIFSLYYYVCRKMLFSFMTGFIFPTILMAVSYCIIIYSAGKMRTQKDHKQAVNKRRKRERRVTMNLLRLILIFLICWLPYFVLLFWLESYARGTKVKEMTFSMSSAMRWTKLLSYCHCFIDPLLYAFSIPNIRKELQGIWKGKNMLHTSNSNERQSNL